MSMWDTRMYGTYNNMIRVIGNKAYITMRHTIREGDTITNGRNTYRVVSLTHCNDHQEADLVKEESNDPQRVPGRSPHH